MKNEQIGSGEVGLETGISYVLIGGVLISLVLDIVGMVLLSFEYGSVAIASDPSSYLQGKNFFSFIFDQFARRQSVTPGVFFSNHGHTRSDIDAVYPGGRIGCLFRDRQELQICCHHAFCAGRYHSEPRVALMPSA